MAMKVNFYLNNQLVELPGNFSDLSVEVNFDRDSPTSELAVTTWDFYNETAEIIQNYIDAGLSGGPGIFEGIPFRIEITKDGQAETFESFIDLTDNALLSCDFMRLNAKERGGIEWINANADSFTFDYLKDQNVILPTDYDFVPYVISKIPNYTDTIIAIIGVFVVSNEIASSIADITSTLQASTNILQAPGELARLVGQILYFIGLITTLIKLVADIIKLLIQPVKFHAGMYAKKLLERGCQQLGLDFESTIFQSAPYDELFILPKKYNLPPDPQDDRILGFTSPNTAQQKGYPIKTFGDLLREMKDMFNAKVIIEGDTLRLERIDYDSTAAVYVIPDVEIEEYRTNAEELESSYLIEFATDVNDKNTIDEYEGTVAQIVTEPNTVNDRKNLTMRGLRTVAIPYALGKRKRELTGVEKTVKAALVTISALVNAFVFLANGAISLVNAIGGIINSLNTVLGFFGIPLNINIPAVPSIPPANFGQIINDRIGMLKLENDFVNVDKMFILNKASQSRDNKLPSNNGTLLSAQKLWEDFHNINGFATNAGHDANQWKIVTIPQAPFCFDDYRKVKGNAKVIDPQGREAKIETVKWNVDKQTAEIRYRYREIYTNNLTEKIIVPDGR